MSRLKKWLAWVGVVVGVLALVALIGFRIWRSDPVRNPYCRVLFCPALDDWDLACSLYSESELMDFSDPGARRAWVLQNLRDAGASVSVLENLARATERPKELRYAEVERAARDAGAPRWQCPPLARGL